MKAETSAMYYIDDTNYIYDKICFVLKLKCYICRQYARLLPRDGINSRGKVYSFDS